MDYKVIVEAEISDKRYPLIINKDSNLLELQEKLDDHFQGEGYWFVSGSGFLESLDLGMLDNLKQLQNIIKGYEEYGGNGFVPYVNWILENKSEIPQDFIEEFRLARIGSYGSAKQFAKEQAKSLGILAAIPAAYRDCFDLTAFQKKLEKTYLFLQGAKVHVFVRDYQTLNPSFQTKTQTK